jgi:sialate O-acetylesterase
MFVPLRDTEGAREAIANAQNEQLRLYFINPFFVDRDRPSEPRDWTDGSWNAATPGSVEGFSAVGYHFGRELQKELKIPIGLIESCLGGTTAERWISRKSMEADPELRDSTEQLKHDLYNGMIAPLTRFPIRGVIWYQGESNSPRSWKYRRLLPSLIRCWRDAWELGDIPFLVVQLPGFGELTKNPADSDWAEMRESQLFVSQTVPNVELTVTIDLGDEKDVHPRRKREVGERLALAALARSYGRDVAFRGPTYAHAKVSDGKIIVRFTNVGKGLQARDAQGAELAKGELTGFAISGEDNKFHSANARIEGETVVVWSDEVSHPVAVRFGWAKNPLVNLWNQDGLPASPFRTDQLPLTTRDAK